ncbi:MAG: hypothetical protein U0841_28870 [Chloroflexia bacterium]
MLTADPNLVPKAAPIPKLSYAEAAELSYFGAKVIHPRTMVPAASKEIPIRILNTFEPDFPGTLIAREPGPQDRAVRAITSIGKATLITVEGAGLVGGPRTVARACAVPAAVDANILLLSQSSSEHNICFVVPADAGERLRRGLEAEFAAELARGELSSVSIAREVCILATVGAGMRRARRRRAGVRHARSPRLQHPGDRAGRLGVEHLLCPPRQRRSAGDAGTPRGSDWRGGG